MPRLKCPQCQLVFPPVDMNHPQCPSCGFSGANAAPQPSFSPGGAITLPPPGAQPAGVVTPAFRVEAARPNGLAVASLVLGIIGICTTFFGGVLLSLLALVFGVLGRNQIKQSPQRTGGDGMALAGIVLGIVGLSLTLLGLLIGFSSGRFWFGPGF